MDIWIATVEQIKQAAKQYYGKIPVEIHKQSGYWAYVYFADGTSETVYQWMIS